MQFDNTTALTIGGVSSAVTGITSASEIDVSASSLLVNEAIASQGTGKHYVDINVWPAGDSPTDHTRRSQRGLYR